MKLAWVLLVVAATTARAEASCGTPWWAGVPDQATLPVRGVMFVHDDWLRYGEASRPIDVTWVGTPRRWTTQVADHAVLRIDYDAGAATATDLGTEYAPQRVRFDAAWRAPSSPPRVIQTWHHVDHWTCSWADELAIQLDQSVAAVRARWTFDGITRELLVVPQTDGARSVLTLGKTNCGGSNVDPDELARGGRLELHAIRFDGTEVPVRGLPGWISTAGLPRDEELLGRAMEVLSTSERAVAFATRTPARTGPRGWLALAGLALGLVAARALRPRSPDAC